MNLEELGYDDWFRVRLGENLARKQTSRASWLLRETAT